MDSDEVNSISDTVESMQVANFIKDIYWEIVDERDLPHHNAMFALEASTDPANPTNMHLPDNVSKVNWIKYDVRAEASGLKEYVQMHWMDPRDFVEYTDSRNSTDTDSNLVVTYQTNIPLVISKVNAPTYYTTFDDEYFVFDSYNATLEATLQSSKSLCYGAIRPTFEMTDTFIPALPENLFNLLYTTATNRCHGVSKQQINPMLDRNEKRVRVRAQSNKFRQEIPNQWPDFGRKGK